MSLTTLPTMSSLCDFSKPEESRLRMQEVLGDQACQGDYRDELLIQIARTYGLTRDFDKRHEMLEPLYTGTEGLLEAQPWRDKDAIISLEALRRNP